MQASSLGDRKSLNDDCMILEPANFLDIGIEIRDERPSSIRSADQAQTNRILSNSELSNVDYINEILDCNNSIIDSVHDTLRSIRRPPSYRLLMLKTTTSRNIQNSDQVNEVLTKPVTQQPEKKVSTQNLAK